MRLPIYYIRPAILVAETDSMSTSAASCYSYTWNSDSANTRNGRYRMDVGSEMYLICVSKALLLERRLFSLLARSSR
ncbi:hypothetical protein PISMIDRAFT_623636 [Pisolithus microcarpus 441]|uniref:Uncharacterized protein n=1 Tax=Pisolithus microcarpus 441 TaxID=765257 RepID=A0A0C9Z009_9AGAM|nr:hypothetical protein BKA83DRAFT_623636 [Pisolithus microcarpus]KIK19564.1 hypothetical protein PISMIDRAFT_623636 [Pisolithus microcarpus 441]